MEAFNNVYKDKTVLVTGHTGFKGSWLSIWLRELGANVVGYSLDPYTEKDNFVLSKLADKIIDIRGDIRDKEKLNKVFVDYQPDFVFHLAAQPLVRLSYEKPVETYEVNVIGTINVLEAIRNCKNTKIGVMITTDKCYENKEQLWGYRETDALGGYDPYSSSKGAAEIAINSWRLSFMNPKEYDRHGKSIASVRAGNVIGGGDWAQDRIIPDCIRALESNVPIQVRNPMSVRPWQHVLDPLRGYLLLAEKMYYDPINFAEPWNFGPELESVISVWEIARKLIQYYGKGVLKDVSNKEVVHEAKLLALDISKSKIRLEWNPTIDVNRTIELTVDWYNNYTSQDVYRLCVKQIVSFMNNSSSET